MIRKPIQSVLKKNGYEALNRDTRLGKGVLRADFNKQTKPTIKETISFTLTLQEHIEPLVNTIQYIVLYHIDENIKKNNIKIFLNTIDCT